MTESSLWQLSATELAAKISSKQVSVREVVTSAVDRMRQTNGLVNAVTLSLEDEAIAAADLADKALDQGERCGPLHGVPITIKENVDQQGIPNTNGVPAFADNIAHEDSPVVKNLKQAGAIVIGRTNTPEFSFRWFTDNPLRGLTQNPWNAQITPGGSSGGAASSVALGIGAIAHGNDLGGSLRYPAYACGVSTIKPGLGRIPAYNATATEERPPTLQLMSVQGPIAREVADLKLALKVMAERDIRDPWWVPAPIEWPQETGLPRVAMTFGPDKSSCDSRVVAAVESAADSLADAGYTVVKQDPPCMEEACDMWRRLIGADTAEMVTPTIRKHGSAVLNKLADDFSSFDSPQSMSAYMKLSAERTRVWREWAVFMEQYPIVLAPVSQSLPFLQGADEGTSESSCELIHKQGMLYLVNLLGLPAASVPTGLIEDNIPVGVQLVGRRFREDQCLDAAAAIEQTTGVLAHALWERI